MQATERERWVCRSVFRLLTRSWKKRSWRRFRRGMIFSFHFPSCIIFYRSVHTPPGVDAKSVLMSVWLCLHRFVSRVSCVKSQNRSHIRGVCPSSGQNQDFSRMAEILNFTCASCPLILIEKLWILYVQQFDAKVQFTMSLTFCSHHHQLTRVLCRIGFYSIWISHALSFPFA